MTHLEGIVYQCTKCNSSFETKQLLKAHQTSCQTNEQVENLNENSSEVPNVKETNFDLQSSENGLMKMSHEEWSSKIDSLLEKDGASVKCKVCGYNSIRQASVVWHVEIHMDLEYQKQNLAEF